MADLNNNNKDEDKSCVRIYVDGACKDNGKKSAKGGCGVYWGEFHPMNCTESLVGELQTNNRAELSAAIIAIAQARTIRIESCQILTDSKYVKDGITKWINNWKQNGWKTTKGSDVLNKDLWLLLNKLFDLVQVQWSWVEAHKGEYGNIKSDELAKHGINENSQYWQKLVMNTDMSTPDLSESIGTAKLDDNKEPSTENVICENSVITSDRIRNGDVEMHERESNIDTKHDKTNNMKQNHSTEIPESENISKDGIANLIHRHEQPATDSRLNKGINRKYDEMESEIKGDVKCEIVCSFCKRLPRKTNEPSIQCAECKSWCHYKCTKLPKYQLHVYENTSRKFSCQMCSGLDEGDANEVNEVCTITRSIEVQTQWKGESIGSISDSIKGETKATQTVEKTRCSKENQTEKMNNENANESSSSVMEKSIELMEKSFLHAIEKITQRNTDSDMLKMEIKQLKDTNLRLNAQITKKDEIINKNQMKQDALAVESDCKNCKKSQQEMVKLKNEVNHMKERNHEMYLEKEMQVCKQQNEIRTLKLQLEAEVRNVHILNEEVKLRDAREITKNDIITRLESTLKEQSFELLRLHDEYISLRLHESRQSDLLCEKDNKNRSVDYEMENVIKTATIKDCDTNKKQSPNKDDTGVKTITPRSEDIKKVETDAKHKGENEQLHMQAKQETRTNKTVELIGTSNIRYVSRKFLEDGDLSVSKTTKYTVEETLKHISNIKENDKKDLYVLNMLCNDVASKDEEQCIDGVMDAIKGIKDKVPNSKIIISLGLPRNTDKMNRKIERINISLKEKCANRESISVCDNSNLFYRGKASRGVLENDGLHLTRQGTHIFSKNLKYSIDEALNIRQKKESFKQDRSFRSGYNQGYNRGPPYSRRDRFYGY